ncbi:GNAT family N-acetyltransferase [Pedobacter cryophilus]|uniref:GNAT family N-acetyltransferase n=1 Tax=Pedobacter cryophilus TaxID=2571271 RepID=A0A4U1BX90_9SPHI|nr:GNAT family N-acetyltransferase [Pedobacter cryophilus]TKB97612.1 GNAT family N-acetyltransferase [Pedobacter cryophilus]
MIQIITIHQKNEWKQFVEKSNQYDFYHTWYYHNMDKTGDPILFVYTKDTNFIAFPLIKRNIPNSNLFDLTSVYGYSGPISNLPFENIPTQMKENFKTEFSVFLKKYGSVSVFSRFNPLLNQLSLMDKFDGIYDNGLVVVIDLQVSIEEQRSNYNRKLWRHIKKLKNEGYYMKEVNTLKGIKDFTHIYIANMKRLGASEFYMFTEDYFQNLLNAEEFKAKLFMLYYEDEPVAGELIICTQKIMQSHLLAASDKYYRNSPAKLLTDEITILGRELGMHYFNLGGGLGFKEDSLFAFKSTYSKLFMDFKSWRYIADQYTYNLLLQESNIDPNSNVDFFPLYRYKSFKKCSLTKEKVLEVEV